MNNSIFKYSIRAFVLNILLINACQVPITASELDGHWVAVEVTENEKPLQVDPAEIHFRFDERSMAYNYQSTLNYKEAGSFFLNGNILHTLDTLNQASTEKIVSISLLSEDSLRIFMVDQGNPRTITLIKE